MDLDSRARSERDFKTEDDPNDIRMADDKPTYRSWKKKYRKMRIKFDQKMHEGEELHKLEQKALATARRLAVQKEYAALTFSPYNPPANRDVPPAVSSTSSSTSTIAPKFLPSGASTSASPRPPIPSHHPSTSTSPPPPNPPTPSRPPNPSPTSSPPSRTPPSPKPPSLTPLSSPTSPLVATPPPTRTKASLTLPPSSQPTTSTTTSTRSTSPSACPTFSPPWHPSHTATPPRSNRRQRTAPSRTAVTSNFATRRRCITGCVSTRPRRFSKTPRRTATAATTRTTSRHLRPPAADAARGSADRAAADPREGRGVARRLLPRLPRERSTTTAGRRRMIRWRCMGMVRRRARGPARGNAGRGMMIRGIGPRGVRVGRRRRRRGGVTGRRGRGQAGRGRGRAGWGSRCIVRRARGAMIRARILVLLMGGNFWGLRCCFQVLRGRCVR